MEGFCIDFWKVFGTFWKGCECFLKGSFQVARAQRASERSERSERSDTAAKRAIEQTSSKTVTKQIHRQEKHIEQDPRTPKSRPRTVEEPLPRQTRCKSGGARERASERSERSARSAEAKQSDTDKNSGNSIFRRTSRMINTRDLRIRAFIAYDFQTSTRFPFLATSGLIFFRLLYRSGGSR